MVDASSTMSHEMRGYCRQTGSGSAFLLQRCGRRCK
jgi:hypothetical protein